MPWSCHPRCIHMVQGNVRATTGIMNNKVVLCAASGGTDHYFDEQTGKIYK